MDLHTDILTGETRNLLRLLLPERTRDRADPPDHVDGAFRHALRNLPRAQARPIWRAGGWPHLGYFSAVTASAAPDTDASSRSWRPTSPSTPSFGNGPGTSSRGAKAQVTEAGLDELLADALHRSINQDPLPESKPNAFFHLCFEMIENGDRQLRAARPLGVAEELAEVVREIHSLWHEQLLAPGKKPGWGREFDERSDAILGRVGEILGAGGTISDDVYKFAIAYGRLSMSLPYVAYHTIDAIILSQGYTSL